MAVLRRSLLLVAIASPVLAAGADPRRGERAIGSPKAPHTAIECFSLSCPHCAAFARETMPTLRADWVTPGKLRWVYYDLPTDLAALGAAMVARYLPEERYERFIETLFATQDRWAFGGGELSDTLWPLAADAGMQRPTFNRALADTGLRDWIVSRAAEAQSRWNIDSTPSFVIDDKVYAGAMSAGEFATILAG